MYPPPPPALSPVDCDSDGLADWLEDANGDGLVGANETDPQNPMSRPETGRFDGEWWAERSPELRVWEYRNDSALRWAKPDAPGMVVKSSQVTPLILIHEYGHMADLDHRGWVFNDQMPNPGDPDDTTAVMYAPQEGAINCPDKATR